MEKTLYSLHLCGATGQSHIELHEGREHLVVPVVALMEGVIHAVNAATPEFVPLATLIKAATSWNGRPVVLGHPIKDGRQCSANSPGVLASHGIGTIFNARIEGKKLLCEAWIDKAKAKLLNAAMFARLLENKIEEVSVGAFVVTDSVAGDWNGKQYKASWLETIGDHLAFLPGGRGACSVEMGCGTHRAAMHLVTASAIEPINSLRALSKLLTIAAKMEDCVACKGSGNVDGNPCEACDGEGELRAAMGARHSAEDVALIQAVHDQAMGLGATCDRANYKMLGVSDNAAVATIVAVEPQLRAANCGCKESTMDKTKKAELIAALVTCEHSGYKAGDEAFLETASDVRLEEFRAAAETRKTAFEANAKLETEHRATAAKLTVIEGKLKTAEAPPTEDEWLAKAPSGIKTLLENQKAAEAELRESLIKELKTAAANTEDELKAMPTAQLQTLAKYAKVQTADFSGRGIPAPRGAADADDFTPPDPYAVGIKALQTVN